MIVGLKMPKQKGMNASLDLHSVNAFFKFQKNSLVFVVILLLVAASLPSEGFTVAPTIRSVNYRFSVDQEGLVGATIDFLSSESSGSFWILVPNSGNWTRMLLHGSILRYELTNAHEVANVDNPFYAAFKFDFKSSEFFQMIIKFNMTIGAIVIEPRGMFFSPLIGFQESKSGKAEVFLPKNSKLVKAAALGDNIQYGPTTTTHDYAVFDLQKNILRLQIEFKTATSEPELVELKRGIFSFETPKQYESYASTILKLFDITYDSYNRLFNVSLESVKMRFFMPEFDTLLSVGGYVPFSGSSIGDIHINLFFARSLRGVLEIIALHELVHHFVLKAGVSPKDFLWFHEGLAQYVSIETANRLGYTEGAASERRKFEDGILLLVQQTAGDIHFIQDWTPEIQPVNIDDYYVASYHVVSKLVQNNNGLVFYEIFFKLLNGTKIETIHLLAYYLSLASRSSVVPMFRSWGFTVADLYEVPTQVVEAERAISEVNPLFQPYKLLAEYFYRAALASLERGNLQQANRNIETSILLARNAASLTLVTLAAILVASVYVLMNRKTSFPADCQLQF